MAWMSQYLVWVTLVSTTAYKCKYTNHHGGIGENVDGDISSPKYLGVQHRVDENPQNHDRVYAQTTEPYIRRGRLKAYRRKGLNVDIYDAASTETITEASHHHDVSTTAYKCKYSNHHGGIEEHVDENISSPKYLGTQHRVDENPQNHDRSYAQTTEPYIEYGGLKNVDIYDAARTETITELLHSPVKYNQHFKRLSVYDTTPTTVEESTFDEKRQFGEVGLKTNAQGNERSLPVSSDIQRVNEQEKIRFHGKRRGENLPRIENGTYKIVNNYPKTFLGVGDRRGAQDDKRPVTSRTPSRDNVVFPGPTSKSPYLLAPDVPEECIKTGICSEVPNYPEDLVDKIVEKLGDATNKFRVDEFVPEIAQRLGPVDNFIELCNYREDLVLPRAAQDRDGKWHFILNPKDKPLQGYRVEICQGKNLPCSTDIAYFNQGYEGICHQKYVERFMTGLDDKGQMIEKPFKVPSCCSCVVRSLKDKFDD